MGLMNWLKGYKSPTIRVRMVVSVNDLIAGEQYDLPVELADEYIIKNYALGTLSRPFTDDQIAHMTRLDQKVGA
jgi:hypothetical protein